MEHGNRHEAVDARAQIAALQRSVQGWADGDSVLPADGSALLVLLEQALDGLKHGDAGSAQAGITAFMGRLEALIEAGILNGTDGLAEMAMAAALAAGPQHF
jgi:hypothetical protein